MSNFVLNVVDEVGLRYSEEMFERIKENVEGKLRYIVQSEIDHIARQFSKFIIGSQTQALRVSRADLTSNTNNVRDGTIPTIRDGLADLGLPKWAPLNAKYVRRKVRQDGAPGFFQNKGFLGDAMRKGSTWIDAFGPITVKLIRLKSSELQSDIGNLKPINSESGKRFSVARIEVGAFGSITPAMLPAVATGDPSTPFPADARRTGLLRLLPDAIAYRLGGDIHVPYRPSLEPFLAFAITRSIPSAVAATINRGLGADTRINTYRKFN